MKTLLSGCDCGLLNAWSVLSVKYNIFNYQPFNCCFAVLRGLPRKYAFVLYCHIKLAFSLAVHVFEQNESFVQVSPCSRDTKVKGQLSSNQSRAKNASGRQSV